MGDWLAALPEWRVHPTNESKSVSAHFGPTILSEHDCVMHFARFLAEAGVAWEDLHLELSPGQWMYRPRAGIMPKRIDLAIVERERLLAAELPVALGDLRLDAVFEFALGSNYWRFGGGTARALLNKVDEDVAKVGEYLTTGLADRGYVVVVEECDHRFPAAYADEARLTLQVEVVLLQQWRSA
jgi:hypothetical protein